MKYVLLVLFSTSLVLTTKAQRLRAGLSFGIDASRMAVNDASGTPLTYINRPTGGILVEAVVSKVLTIQAEANYSSQGLAGLGDGGTTLSYTFNYITIPLVAKLYGTPNLSFLAGGQAGILMNARYSYNEDHIDYKNDLESKDYYALIGLEYRFNNGVFGGTRYHVGLTDIEKEPARRMHNRYFSFRVGYSFSFKK